MKKYLFLLLAAALMACGCTKEYITQEYITEETVIQGADMDIIDFTVKDADWVMRDGYFEVVLKVPEITKTVVENGTVQVSRRYTDNGQTYWTPLPSMRVEVTESGDGSDFFYTVYTDFEWSEGQVNVFVTTTDLYTGECPGDMALRVIVLM